LTDLLQQQLGGRQRHAPRLLLLLLLLIRTAAAAAAAAADCRRSLACHVPDTFPKGAFADRDGFASDDHKPLSYISQRC
jgi:hypothetical protein